MKAHSGKTFNKLLIKLTAKDSMKNGGHTMTTTQRPAPAKGRVILPKNTGKPPP